MCYLFGMDIPCMKACELDKESLDSLPVASLVIPLTEGEIQVGPIGRLSGTSAWRRCSKTWGMGVG